MTKEELHAFLRRYTPAETAYIRGDFSEASNEEEFRKYRLLDGNTYLFEGRLFMNSGEKIGVARQDRFNKVYAHKHDYIELCYVWSGSCRQTIEGKEVLTRQGDVCIFDTQAVHSIEAAGEEDLIVNILMRQDFFDTAFLSRMTRQGIVSEFFMEAVSKNRKNKHYLYFPSGKSQLCLTLRSIFWMEVCRKWPVILDFMKIISLPFSGKKPEKVMWSIFRSFA